MRKLLGLLRMPTQMTVSKPSQLFYVIFLLKYWQRPPSKGITPEFSIIKVIPVQYFSMSSVGEDVVNFSFDLSPKFIDFLS